MASTVVETLELLSVDEPTSVLETVEPLPAIIVGAVKSSSIKILRMIESLLATIVGTVEQLPAIVVGAVEPLSMLGTVELLSAIIIGTVDPLPAAVL